MTTVQSRSRDDVIFGNKGEKKKEPPVPAPIQSAIDSLSPDDSANTFKDVGNQCFAAGCFTAAIRCYTKGLEQEPHNEVLLANRSASYLQSPMLAGPSLALKDADKAVAAKGDWFKGHLRRGDALFAMKKFHEALEAYERTLSLNPGCHTAADSKRHCQREILLAGDAVPGSGAREEAEATPSRQQPAPHHTYNAETHRTEKRSFTEQERLDAEKHLDTETLVRTWTTDTAQDPTVTACKKRNVNLAEADRETGKSYKEQLMSNFRKKVSTDTQFASNLEARKESDLLKGDGVNYRHDAENAKRRLEKGTDGIGLAISAEAYRTTTGKSGSVW